MKVLIVGQGGREHVLAWKLAQSPSVNELFCAPGNAGTAQEGTNLEIADTDAEALVAFVRDKQIDLAVIGPEAPLVAGVSDALVEAGCKVFGPSRQAAELEGSKIFAKQLMRDAGVPTADFQAFDRSAYAMEYITEREVPGLVVKADGLAAGKGVYVCGSKPEARDAVEELMIKKRFGDAGAKIVIEERLTGQEASILAIVDGTTIMPLEIAQDHKAAYDDDKGPNTGGMGAYCPAPLVTPAMMDQIIEKILFPTVHTMRKRNRKFQGVLYAGLMITPQQGPKVLEFNVRFGDPEAQPVLMRLQTDLAAILHAAASNDLKNAPIPEWDPRPAVCVVMAAEGYPGNYQKGHVIRGLEEAGRLPDVKVFHAGTTFNEQGQVVTNGGRVLGVTALGDTIPDAKLRAYQAVKEIRWEGAWCRKDISDKAR